MSRRILQNERILQKNFTQNTPLSILIQELFLFVIKFLTITLSFCKIRPMNLKEYRTKNNLSVIKLASILGISRQHVYELEKPEHKPSVKLAKKIETLLNREVTAVELLGIN